MAERDFTELVTGGLLRDVEEIVVASHRELYARQGRPWTKPDAYRWLRYEAQAPVERLAEGAQRLGKLGAGFDADAVEKACRQASKSGFLI